VSPINDDDPTPLRTRRAITLKERGNRVQVPKVAPRFLGGDDIEPAQNFGDQPMIVVAAVLRPEVRDVPRYKKKRAAGFWLERSGPFSFATRAIARLRHQRRTQIQISAWGIRAWLACR
jgi:hypothetical protein